MLCREPAGLAPPAGTATGLACIYANTPLLTILRLALPPATGYAFAQRRKDAAYHY
ncbi:hypothetical protein DWUX_2382 [Desulfovibrio diazotrophicus]|nr:hypothetical protein DWUX_2382 [Desulfovibrio diazotrophicus]